MRDLDRQRSRMVEEQLRRRGIRDPRVLAIFERLPRHQFMPEVSRADAYLDQPVPIGEGQTVSQPYIVALMIETLHLQGEERVLEIGTGSGYQTAILAYLAREVYSIERLATLAAQARVRLHALGLDHIHLRVGDGALGWPEAAPFDRIIVSAAAREIPVPLKEQLAEGGSLVMPVGPPERQMLIRLTREGSRCSQADVASCVFVPLVKGGDGTRDTHDDR